MKIIKYINTVLFILAFFLGSCKDNEPEIENFPSDRISFDYKVFHPTYQLDYFRGDTILFINTSVAQGACSWNFGDPYASEDDNRSVLPEAKHAFEEAGVYEVTLTVEGEGSVRKKIMVSDISPRVTVDEIEGGFCEVGITPIHLNLYLPNPKNEEAVFTWKFPEGTLDADGQTIETSGLRDPGKLRFSNIGSQKVILETVLGGRRLEDAVINVQVGYTEPAKTLYYAVKGGNIMAYKLIPNLPATMKVLPLDLGVKSGNHPMNILFNDSLLYVLDPGKQFSYMEDKDSILGDGKISVIAKDGSRVETMLTNVGKYNYDDPYFGYIDSKTNLLYFSDRNTGIRTISLDKRNEVFSRGSYPSWVENGWLGYYNKGMVYGAITSCITKVGDVWWWSKIYNGTGIFRFKESDIIKGGVSSSTPEPASGQIFPNLRIKTFVVDEARSMLYFVCRDDDHAGFYSMPLSDVEGKDGGSKIKPYLVKSLVPDTEGGATETIYICQLALDKEDGSVYFGYRTGDAAAQKSALMRYNPATQQLETLIEGVDIYGVAINDNKSQLF